MEKTRFLLWLKLKLFLSDVYLGHSIKKEKPDDTEMKGLKKLIESKLLTLFFCDEENYLIRNSSGRNISESCCTQSEVRSELINACASSPSPHSLLKWPDVLKT